MTKAKVYFTKEITPQSLIAIYKAPVSYTHLTLPTNSRV